MRRVLLIVCVVVGLASGVSAKPKTKSVNVANFPASQAVQVQNFPPTVLPLAPTKASQLVIGSADAVLHGFLATDERAARAAQAYPRPGRERAKAGGCGAPPASRRSRRGVPAACS
jgi:hypothetical protein